MTTREWTIAGVGVAAVALVYEFFLSPSAKASIATAKSAGRPLGPLGSRPLTSTATAPIVPAKASVATPYTTRNPSPGAPLGGLTLGTALPGLLAGLANAFRGAGSPPTDPKKATSGSGFSMGGAPSQGGAGYGKQGGQGVPQTMAPVNVTAGGPDPALPYVDTTGTVGYPAGGGFYTDEQGNPLMIDKDSGQLVAYEPVGPVDPTTYAPVGPVDANDYVDPSTGMPLSATTPASDPADPLGAGGYLDNLPGAGTVDSQPIDASAGFIDPNSDWTVLGAEDTLPVVDPTDMGGGGGQTPYYDDVMDYGDF